jgi:hypothetical protein
VKIQPPTRSREVDPHTLPPKHDHPATFSKALFPYLIEELVGCHHVLDPFAGVGTIHILADAAGVPRSTGIELEEEWANADLFASSERVQYIGDARHWVPLIQDFDCVVTSPAYANRMADHHDAKERCKACGGVAILVDGCVKCDGKGFRQYKRNTYKHRLGRDLTEGNSGGMQWTGSGGDEYRALHQEIWTLCIGGLTPGGKFVLNIKDHYRGDKQQYVTDWHHMILIESGLTPRRSYKIPTPGNRQGANREKRIDYESVLVYTKGEAE